MRKVLAALVAVGLIAALAVPAHAGEVVKSKTKVVDAFDEEGDTIGIYAKLKTTADCRSPKRKFLLFRGNDKIDTENGYSDTFFLTDEVQVGDTVEVKTKTARIQVAGERITCKGSTSKPFVVDHLKPG